MEPIEVIVLSAHEQAHCRLRETGEAVICRASRPWELIPGEIAMIRPRKRWRFGARQYLSGDVVGWRLDVVALNVTPLRLERRFDWDPAEEYWGEDDEPLPDWAVPIVERGPRPAFEMEQVLPGVDWNDVDDDPIVEAADLAATGHPADAIVILMDLLHQDLRCLDAHAHLGNIAFRYGAADALRHYDVGVQIGELTLGPHFSGVLPWGCIDNRPFLRCLHGYGLCLWRLGRSADALGVFQRLLCLNPSDNQGIRFLLPEVHAGRPCRDRD